MDINSTTPPSPGGARRRPGRLGRLGIAAIAAVVGVLTVSGAVAMATSGNDDPPTTAASGGPAGRDHTAVTGRNAPRAPGQARHRHDHPPLTPYDERYADASAGQQAVADDLQAQVDATLAAYDDVDKAVAAGFRPPRRADAVIAHYVNMAAVRDGKVLDPSAPEGLVYFRGRTGEPILLGAFFVALPGQQVPDGAGGIVVWHSHNPDCTAFFATPAAPCLDQRRMLHVWTADRTELVLPRSGRTVAIEVTDPFGTPFRASVARAD